MTSTLTARDQDRFFIGGAWVAAQGAERVPVINPTTEEVVATIPCATATDIDAAVAAARAAWSGWARTPVEERAALCTAVAQGLQARGDEIAGTITTEMGSPIAFSSGVQLALGVMDFAGIEHVVAQMPWEQEIGNALIVREPLGVVGAITPWNYPLHQIAAKVSAAMAAGCTIVVKPSEVTPLTAYLLAEVLAEVGVPDGVVNVVAGTGAVAGEAIARHPWIDVVSFTGSTRAGRQVSAAAAATVKKVALELGGKSPYVILDDADLEAAVVNGVIKGFVNGGQTCSALTRMLVPRHLLGAVEEIVAAVVGQVVVGDPADPATQIGPMSSAVQRDRVESYLRQGVEAGARLVVGGPGGLPDLARGYYVRPTVFSDVTPDMSIVREEIFGPVLVLQPYADVDDAVRIANDSDYGLAGGVFSASEERALAVARRLRTGQVEINGAAFNPLAPFGGFKQSGHGRELGPYGIEEFLSLKSIQR